MPSKMKTCEDYRTGLNDAAAEAVEPSLELRSHLDACALCRTAFAKETQLFAAIDSGVRNAASAEVPASLLPRVRAHLNERSVPRRSWVPASATMAAAVLVAAMVVFVRGLGRDAVPTNPPINSLAHNVSPAEIRQTPVAPFVETMRPPAKGKLLHPAKTPPVAEVARVEAVRVLVPAGQKQAMDALLAGVRQGQVKADVLLAENSGKTLEDLQLSPLDISPIEVKPLADVSAESPSQNEKTGR